MREKVMGGMHKAQTAQQVIDAIRIHYNFCREHQTLLKTLANPNWISVRTAPPSYSASVRSRVLLYQLSLSCLIVLEEKSNILFRNHFSLFVIPVIMLSAVILYYIMARPKFNFTEILVCCLFGAGTYFMMCLISDLVLGFIFKINILTANIFLWQTILSSLYNFWFTFDFFKRLRLRLFWLRLISVSILVAIAGWAIMVYLPMVWLYFTTH